MYFGSMDRPHVLLKSIYMRVNMYFNLFEVKVGVIFHLKDVPILGNVAALRQENRRIFTLIKFANPLSCVNSNSRSFWIKRLRRGKINHEFMFKGRKRC